MSLLGHIVERCGGSCQTGITPGRQGQVPVAGDELFLQDTAYIFLEHWQRRITRKRSLPWCRRLGLNQRIPPGAVLYRLSYVCIPPASAGVRRKERMDGKNEDTDITPHPHSDTSVRQHSSKWRNLKYLFSVQLRVSLALIPAKLVKANVVIRSNQFQLRQPRFPCASLVPSQCVPAQPHQFRCHIPADNRVSAFSEPLQPFRERTHMITSRRPFSRRDCHCQKSSSHTPRSSQGHSHKDMAHMRTNHKL